MPTIFSRLSENMEDTRAEKEPVYDLDKLLGSQAREPRVSVGEFKPPHDEKTTWHKTKKATIARKKAAQRAKPTLKKKLGSILKRKDDDGTTMYLLGGIGAVAALAFLMKH